jgi:hypothetical protein
MTDELSGAKKELQKYRGDEVPVADAVSIVARATGLRVHLLEENEVSPALEHAKKLITAGKVREGPYEAKNEIVRASRESWTDLSSQARSLVGTLWSEKAGADIVVTTLDPVQTKEKILSLIENILVQKKRFALDSHWRTPT